MSIKNKIIKYVLPLALAGSLAYTDIAQARGPIFRESENTIEEKVADCDSTLGVNPNDPDTSIYALGVVGSFFAISLFGLGIIGYEKIKQRKGDF